MGVNPVCWILLKTMFVNTGGFKGLMSLKSKMSRSDKTREELVYPLLDKFYHNREECSAEEISRVKEWFSGLKFGKEVYQRARREWDETFSSGDQKELLDEILYKIYYRIRVEEFKKEKEEKKVIRLRRIIASIAVSVILIIVGYLFGNVNDSGLKNVYSELHAPYGSRVRFELPDGTAGWLNSGSSLRYPVRFTGKKRIVSLEGEGYFDVKHDPGRPFIVQTSGTRVIALGTSFNVQAFANSEEEEITLVKGKVVIEKKLMSDDSKYRHLLIMKPRQHVGIDVKTGRIVFMDWNTEKYIAWKDGKLVFRNDPLSRVVNEMERYYNVDIEVQDPQLSKYHFHATFEDETLFESLRLLSLSSAMDYIICKRQKNPDGTFKKRKVILYRKKNDLT